MYVFPERSVVSSVGQNLRRGPCEKKLAEHSGKTSMNLSAADGTESRQKTTSHAPLTRRCLRVTSFFCPQETTVRYREDIGATAHPSCPFHPLLVLTEALKIGDGTPYSTAYSTAQEEKTKGGLSATQEVMTRDKGIVSLVLAPTLCNQPWSQMDQMAPGLGICILRCSSCAASRHGLSTIHAVRGSSAFVFYVFKNELLKN